MIHKMDFNYYSGPGGGSRGPHTGPGSTPPQVNWRTLQPKVSHAENLNCGPKGERSSDAGNSGVQCRRQGGRRSLLGVNCLLDFCMKYVPRL